MLEDLRYALRTLVRSPGYAAAAVVTLALGIGANTAIFGAIDEVLFRPPDLPQAERLAQAYSFNRKTGTYLSSSYPDYADMRDGARSFADLAAYVRLPLNVRIGGSAAERISVEAVSGNYFAALAVPPVRGRAIGGGDDRAGAAPVAMIAEDVWRTRFGGDGAVVGKTIAIGGVGFTVVGVVSRRVAGLNLNWATPPKIWIPLHASALVVPALGRLFGARGGTWLVVMGRLQAGIAVTAAQAELEAIAARIAGGRDLTVRVFPLSGSKFWPSYRKDIETSLAGFAIASGLILLLACANVSNLLLGRAVGRRREMAVRMAIGAGRGRIVRQLLTESAVLAGLSGAAAVAVARGLMQLLLRFPNALGLPLALELGVDWRTLGFCFGLAAATVALFGLAPALATVRVAILPALKEGGSAAGARGHWFRGALVAVQAALAMVLLVGGGLYGRSLWKAYSADLGFRSDHLLTAEFSLPPPGAEAAERGWAAQRALLEALRAMPGVVSATVSWRGVLNAWRSKAAIEGGVVADCEFAGRDFFGTMGIALLEGRDFRAGDEGGEAAVVSRSLAARMWPGGGAVGRTMTVDAPGRTGTRVVVVGVAGDARYDSVWAEAAPRLYLAAGKRDVAAGFLAVRTAAPPRELAPPVVKLWDELAPGSPLYGIESGAERLDGFLTPQRVAAGILGGFAVLALALTAVGLYGVVAFAVAERKREIGIRMAIGARPGAVFRAVLGRSLMPTAAGMAAGAAASVPLMRVLAAKAREVAPYDAGTYVAVAAVLMAVVCVAAIVPARRAMRVDPAEALRSE